MHKLFNDYLSEVSGAIRNSNSYDVFKRRKEVSTYYWNCASDLHAAAIILGHAAERDFCMSTEQLGLGSGFCLSVALPPPFRLNAGMSIELLLKAIGKILGRPEHKSHRLNELCRHVGIVISHDMAATLEVFTESIYWEGRYPVPKEITQWENSNQAWSNIWSNSPEEGKLKFRIPIPERWPNLSNYQLIWEELWSYYWNAKEVIHEF